MSEELMYRGMSNIFPAPLTYSGTAVNHTIGDVKYRACNLNATHSDNPYFATGCNFVSPKAI